MHGGGTDISNMGQQRLVTTSSLQSPVLSLRVPPAGESGRDGYDGHLSQLISVRRVCVCVLKHSYV